MAGRPRAGVKAVVLARRLVSLLALALAILLLTVAQSPRAEGATSGDVHLLTIEGVINPLTAQYLARGIQEGAEAQAEAVVVVLNTPGGLESSTRDMTRAMLNSPVPVVVYVAPAGARAASAGMFITIAAHVAAMAPGTNIGAAHPVGLGGQTDPVMAEKIVNDAAALARSIANTRGRNAVWAEQAVRESVSITATEAVDENVIDFVAADLPDVLRQMDGRQVVTTVEEVTLRTTEARVVERPMTFAERILHTIIDPNIAYILFTIGVIGLIAELYNPGALFPGITGVISLVMAFVAFGNLPINWAGVVLLGLAFGLFVGELYTEGIGILAVGGLVAFILGSLLLYRPLTPTSPAMPELSVNPWLIGGLSLGILAFFLVVARAILRARRLPVATGTEMLIGRIGTAESDLAPTGTVRVNGETWSAVSEAEPIREGERIEVAGVRGTTLRVRKRS